MLFFLKVDFCGFFIHDISDLISYRQKIYEVNVIFFKIHFCGFFGHDISNLISQKQKIYQVTHRQNEWKNWAEMYRYIQKIRTISEESKKSRDRN